MHRTLVLLQKEKIGLVTIKIMLIVRGVRKCLFHSHSHWFIPIPIHTPRFSLLLFQFSSHSHWLFPFPAAPIAVLLVCHQLTDDR